MRVVFDEDHSIFLYSKRARELALLFFRGVGWLGVAEVGVDDLELLWGEAFLGGTIAGGLEFGHEGLVGMDLAGEEFARGGFATVWEIGHSKVLFEDKT